MSYLQRILACNRHEPGHFLPWQVDGATVGWIRHALVATLRRWPSVFVVEGRRVSLHPSLGGTEARTAAVAEVVARLHREGLIRHHHRELYPVTANGRDHAVCLINRAAAPTFGVRAFGQHLNGYVRDADGMRMWIARRAASKWNFPGRLDNLVAGGLPHDLTLAANLAKECAEEASIPAELAARARPVGAISYCLETDAGLKPDVMYCYDLELPADFTPRSGDGEVSEFHLLPLAEVARLVRDTEEFKTNCDLVVIDFLVRHGYIGPEEPDYLEMVVALRSQAAPAGRDRAAESGPAGVGVVG